MFPSLYGLIHGWSLGLVGYLTVFPVFLHFIPLHEKVDKKIWDFSIVWVDDDIQLLCSRKIPLMAWLGHAHKDKYYQRE